MAVYLSKKMTLPYILRSKALTREALCMYHSAKYAHEMIHKHRTSSKHRANLKGNTERDTKRNTKMKKCQQYRLSSDLVDQGGRLSYLITTVLLVLSHPCFDIPLSINPLSVDRVQIVGTASRFEPTVAQALFLKPDVCCSPPKLDLITPENKFENSP